MGEATSAELELVYKRASENMVKIWVTPEIERRKQEGVLSDGFVLERAQVIFNHGVPPEVLLNEEIRGVIEVEVAEGVEKAPGDPVIESDIKTVTGIELTDEDPNAGHITLLRWRGSWLLGFDFRYNARHIAEYLAAAKDFLHTARLALEADNLRSFAATLFVAVELVAKATLIESHTYLLQAKSHEATRNRYNLWSHLGNTETEYAAPFNELSALRNPARYPVRGSFKLKQDQAEKMLKLAEQMWQEREKSAPRRNVKK